MDNIEVVDVTAARIILRHVGTCRVFPKASRPVTSFRNR